MVDQQLNEEDHQELTPVTCSSHLTTPPALLQQQDSPPQDGVNNKRTRQELESEEEEPEEPSPKRCRWDYTPQEQQDEKCIITREGTYLSEAIHSYEFLKELSLEDPLKRPNPRYMDGQTVLKPHMRRILVDWMIQLGDEEHYKLETISLAVALVDRFLSVTPYVVPCSRLQLLGVVAIFVATKYYETTHPDIFNCAEFTDGTYTSTEVSQFEVLVLDALNYNIRVRTCIGIIGQLLTSDSDPSYKLCSLLSDLALREYCMLQYDPCVIACACLTIALYSMRLVKWRRFQVFSVLFGDQYEQCVFKVSQLLCNFLDDPSKHEAMNEIHILKNDVFCGGAPVRHIPGFTCFSQPWINYYPAMEAFADIEFMFDQ